MRTRLRRHRRAALSFAARRSDSLLTAGTLHTVVGEPDKRRRLIGIGGDAAALEEDMLDFSPDEWVAHLDGQLGGMSRPFA